MNTVALLLAVSLAAPGVKLAPGARLWIDGDSTLHRYHLDARTLEVTAQADGEGELAAQMRAQKISALSVVVRVGALTSGESGLDENLRKALKASAHPTIAFVLKSYELVAAKDPQAFGAILHGTLTIAGVARQVDVPAQVQVHGASVQVTGSVPLTMSSFGVEPPVLMLGALKTADAVTVGFDLTLAPE